MKKIIYFVIGLLVIGFAIYLTFNTKVPKENKDIQDTQQAQVEVGKFSDPLLGLEFSYPMGPSGYVVDERIPADIGELVRVLILQPSEDVGKPIPEGGEGLPVITISIFTNEKKQSSRVWAEANPQYSNISLRRGEVGEAVVGGVNSIQYMSDGLYSSDNVVVAHGENVYVMHVDFSDTQSKLRTDFSLIVDSVRFIPKPTQE